MSELKPCPFCGGTHVTYEIVPSDKHGNGFAKLWCGFDGEPDSCGAYFQFDETEIGHVAKEWNTRPDSKPLPWLRAEDVTESGSYWWVNDASYATPVTVYVMKSGTDESCFASAGQLGWWKAMQLPALGGLWQRIPEPELPKEGES